MTDREFYSIVAASNLSEEVTAKANELTAKMDARNAKRRATPTKTQVENAPIIEALAAALTADPQLTTTLAATVGASTSKAGALLRQMMATHGVTQVDVKVKGKGTQKGWCIPA